MAAVGGGILRSFVLLVCVQTMAELVKILSPGCESDVYINRAQVSHAWLPQREPHPTCCSPLQQRGYVDILIFKTSKKTVRATVFLQSTSHILDPRTSPLSFFSFSFFYSSHNLPLRPWQLMADWSPFSTCPSGHHGNHIINMRRAGRCKRRQEA